MQSTWWRALWISVLVAPVATLAAPPVATLTILDGDATVLHDASRLTLAQGVRLEADDIAETGAQTRLARIEFNDGLIVDLGPDSRLLLAPRFAGDRSRSGRVYLLRGWAKVTVPKSDKPSAAANVLSSATFDVTSLTRQIVVSIQPGEAMLFTEAGEATLVERQAGRAQPPLVLKADQFVTRSGDAKPTVAPRPTPAFIQRVPRPFLDTLPSRIAVFKDRVVTPKKLADVTWADAQPWVDSETALRPAFPARWKSLAANPEFRQGLLANERVHPEWDRVLHPEKYLPKPKPGASAPLGYPVR